MIFLLLENCGEITVTECEDAIDKDDAGRGGTILIVKTPRPPLPMLPCNPFQIDELSDLLCELCVQFIGCPDVFVVLTLFE